MLLRGSPVRDDVINGSGFSCFRLLLGAAFTPSQSLPHRGGGIHTVPAGHSRRGGNCANTVAQAGERREGAAIGSIRSETITTSPGISTIFTSIRSNTVSSVTRQIGRIRRFAGAQPPGCIPPDGSATGTNRSTPASANEARMGSARDPPALAAAECAALFRPTLAGVGLRASEIPQDPHATKTPSASPPMSRSVL